MPRNTVVLMHSKMSGHTSPPISKLPVELLCSIVSVCEAKDQLALTRVNKLYHAYVESVRYNVLDLTDKTPAQLYCFFMRMTATEDIRQQVRHLTIVQSRHLSPFYIPMEDTDSAWRALEALLPRNAPQSFYERYREILYSKESYKAFLASIITCLHNVKSSVIDLSQFNLGGPVMELVCDETQQASSRSWPNLTTIDIKLDETAMQVPEVTTLHHLIIRGGNEDLTIIEPAASSRAITHLRTLQLTSSNASTAVAVALMANCDLSHLTSLRLTDRFWCPDTTYPDVLSLLSKCTVLQDLCWDFELQDPNDTTVPLSPGSLKCLRSLKSMRMHKDFLFVRGDITAFASLHSNLPEGLRTVEITGIPEQELSDLLALSEAENWLLDPAEVPQRVYGVYELKLIGDLDAQQRIAPEVAFADRLENIRVLQHAALKHGRKFDVATRCIGMMDPMTVFLGQPEGEDQLVDI